MPDFLCFHERDSAARTSKKEILLYAVYCAPFYIFDSSSLYVCAYSQRALGHFYHLRNIILDVRVNTTMHPSPKALVRKNLTPPPAAAFTHAVESLIIYLSTSLHV